MKIKDISILFEVGLLITAALLVSGCWTTVRSDNPRIQTDAAAPHARVYFIRPRTERFMGMADNRVSITLNQEPLLELVKGEYTFIDLVPGKADIAITNQTTYGPSHKINREIRSRPFSFTAGQTYYIAVTPIDGEFRGVRFVPREIDFSEASTLADHARGVGNARWKAFAEATSN